MSDSERLRRRYTQGPCVFGLDVFKFNMDLSILVWFVFEKKKNIVAVVVAKCGIVVKIAIGLALAFSTNPHF